MDRTIISTDKVDNPKDMANYASAVISADYGISNTVEEIKGGFEVVTEDGKVFQFVL